MWNFQRIICIWICCVSCMFGTTQLSTLVAAVPYEYFDDHDQSFYDLDTEQIQAKYDTRLLSQQMLKTPEQQQQILENQKGSHPGVGFGDGLEDVGTNERVRGASFVLDNNKRNEDAAGSSDILTKLKTNDASKSTNSNSNANTNNNNNNIYDGSNKDNAWIDETTAAITEKQEIHLPRAASCYTNGQKYTHGQKVPRHDSCEVCLCMDGEIFCWWEKCDKKTPKGQTPPRYEEDYSTPYGESSTMRILANEKSTVRTTLRPMKKPKINKDYKYGQAEVDGEEDLDGDEERDNVDDGDDAAAPDEDNEYDDITQRHGKRPYKSHNKQQMTKKKSYIGGEHKEALELKEKQMKMKKEKLKKQQQQQQKQQEKHKGNNDHHQYHHPEHHASSGSSSKILNFPENLPSVLYYDYKTEEHQHHQHQHREQHLKHQHEKELKHRQHSGSRHHEYGGGGGVGGGDSDGQDFNADTSVTMPAVATSLVGSASAAGSGNDVVLHRQQPPSSSAKYLGNGNDNIYNVDLQTDSDILPEPPTKKPKLPSIATEMASAVALDSASALASASAAAAGTPTTTLPYRLSTLSATSAATTTNITTRPLKKQMFSPWDYGKPNRDKVNKSINQRRQPSNKAAGIDAGLAPASDGGEDQDDAFHRWLTSTEKNNKNNGPQMGDADDFEGDDKNYENIDIDIDAVSLQGTAKTPVPASPPIAGDEAGHEVAQQLANSGNLKYEINFSDNPNGYPATGANDNNNGNGNDNEDNISPFSNPYQNYKNNNSPTLNNRSGAQSQYGSISTRTSTGPLSSSSSTSSSSSSNEDNGVGSVVNIDIMLTASADMAQQQQQQSFPVPGSLEHDKLNQPRQPNAKQKSLLISNTNGKDNEPLSQFSSSAIGNANNSFDVVVGGDSPQQTLAGGSNLLSSNFSSSDGGSNNISSNSNSQSNSFSHSFKLSPALVSNSTATSSVASASSAQTTPPTSTTLSPERQCNVMGTLYKIGDVLPQDTGNCLQCICIDGSTMDDTPRVTCSPHNCPPLVLPDLFDATGY